jgi:hypothetical protein
MAQLEASTTHFVQKTSRNLQLEEEAEGARKWTDARVPVENENAVSEFIDAIMEVLETKDKVRRGGTVAFSRVVGDVGSKHSEMSASLAKKSTVAVKKASSAAGGIPKQESPIVKAKKEVPAKNALLSMMMQTRGAQRLGPPKERAKDMS